MEHLTSTFQPDTIHEIFKLVWSQTAKGRTKEDATDEAEPEVVAGPSKKTRATILNADALKLTCDLLQMFVTEFTKEGRGDRGRGQSNFSC